MEKRVVNGRYVYSFDPDETKEVLGQGLGSLIKNYNKVDNDIADNISDYMCNRKLIKELEKTEPVKINRV